MLKYSYIHSKLQQRIFESGNKKGRKVTSFAFIGMQDERAIKLQQKQM